jgi:replicative DNA helicase
MIAPHDPYVIERSVLSAAMTGNDALDAVMELAADVDFDHPAHVELFRALAAHYEDRKSVDQITLGKTLEKRGVLQKAGGIGYLSEVASFVASPRPVRHWLRELRDDADKRALQRLGERLTTDSRKPEITSQRLRETADEELRALDETTPGGFTGLCEVMISVSDDLTRASQTDEAPGISTGLVSLDALIDGWRPGYHIIAAGTSEGKSALALKCALAAAFAGEHVAFFSLEMPRASLGLRMMSMESGIDSHRLRRPRGNGLPHSDPRCSQPMTQDDWDAVKAAMIRLTQLDLLIDDSVGITTTEARARLRRVHRIKPLGMVVVDYLQLMGAPRADTREQEVSKISAGVKGIANEFNVPTLALSQLSRKREDGSKPKLSWLRESGSLENDADSVSFIYHPSLHGQRGPNGMSMEGIAEIIVGKNRNGPKGSVYVQWDAPTTKFRDLAPGYQQDFERHDDGRNA